MLIQSVKLLASVTMLLIGATVYAQDLPPEAPIETTDISITRPQPGGLVLARPCENCAMMTLNIDARSRAIHHGKTVPLSAVPEHLKGGLTIIYDPKTKTVRRIIW